MKLSLTIKRLLRRPPDRIHMPLWGFMLLSVPQDLIVAISMMKDPVGTAIHLIVIALAFGVLCLVQFRDGTDTKNGKTKKALGIPLWFLCSLIVFDCLFLPGVLIYFFH
jgi:hypothetical protein